MSGIEDCVVKVGSRKSELALTQTRYVISLLKNLHPEKKFEIVTMSTLGDRVLNVSLPKIGEKSLFTADLEAALHIGSVDLVVHSLKDLPTSLPMGMAIGAVLEREDPRDALVLREDFKGHTLATLPAGSIIGTSSLRRTAQLSRSYPQLKVLDIRGNLNTRLHKLDKHRRSEDEDMTLTGPDYVALILAHAGLQRMGWHERISQVLSSKDVLYAIGQGALAVECRANNHRILRMLEPLNHEDTYCRILTERTFLQTLGGGCSAPVAISTSLRDATGPNGNSAMKQLKVVGAVWSLDGKIKIQDSLLHTFDTVKIFDTPKNSHELKNKSGKHKLLDLEDLTPNFDESGSKHSKLGILSLYPKKSGENNAQKPRLMCCKQKNISAMLKEGDPSEIESLINAHGKLFKHCPLLIGGNETYPVKFSVGQEVMGVCPYYVDENEKFNEQSEKSYPHNMNNDTGTCPIALPVGQEVMGRCPYPVNEQEKFSKQLVKLHPRSISYDINKCPFMQNQVVAINTKLEVNNLNNDVATTSYDTEKEPNAQNCPFLKITSAKTILTENTINTIAENNTNLIGANSKPKEVIESNGSSKEMRLYCGMIKHHNLLESAMEKCEDIGKQLAQALINQGALDVMKCAQDFIRGSITTTPAAVTQ